MLRTWPVRLLAIAFTLSVRSFQVPATPGTTAWPPSLPSVPTSRATRVTSAPKLRSWSTIVLIASFNWRISPRTSTVIFFGPSPFPTATVTSAMLRTWPVRLLAMEFTLSVKSFHTPLTSRTCACPPSLPSVPTSRATRVTSAAKLRSWSTMVLIVSLSWRISPCTSTVIFLERSPFATAVVTSAMLRTWPVRLLALQSTLPPTPVQPPLPPSPPTRRSSDLELAFGADLPRDARHLRREAPELVHHGIDRVLELENFSAHVRRDLLGEVAVRHRDRDVRDVAHLARQ